MPFPNVFLSVEKPPSDLFYLPASANKKSDWKVVFLRIRAISVEDRKRAGFIRSSESGVL